MNAQEVSGDRQRRLDVETLVSLIGSAATRTMRATLHANFGGNSRAGREERAGYRRLFHYVVGRYPTEAELGQMIPG